MKLKNNSHAVRPENCVALLLGLAMSACSAANPSGPTVTSSSVPPLAATSSAHEVSAQAAAPSWLSRIFGSSGKGYSASGSLVLSFQLPPRGTSDSTNMTPAGESPDQELASAVPSTHRRFAPLLGYFPPRLSKLPANNEIWMEFDQAERQLKIYEGKQLLQMVSAESDGKIQCGEYLVQSKQSDPRWYATNQYYTSRGLPVPSDISPERYLQGALGSQALFLSENLAIHSSPLWTKEVGGVRVDRQTLSKVFERAPLGVSVIVR